MRIDIIFESQIPELTDLASEPFNLNHAVLVNPISLAHLTQKITPPFLSLE